MSLGIREKDATGTEDAIERHGPAAMEAGEFHDRIVVDIMCREYVASPARDCCE